MRDTTPHSMDLQAILDTTDSFSSSSSTSSPPKSSSYHAGTGTRSVQPPTTHHLRLELEQILREADDDDDDDEHSSGSSAGHIPLISSLRRAATPLEAAGGGGDYYDTRSVGNTTISTKTNFQQGGSFGTTPTGTLPSLSSSSHTLPPSSSRDLSRRGQHLLPTLTPEGEDIVSLSEYGLHPAVEALCCGPQGVGEETSLSADMAARRRQRRQVKRVSDMPRLRIPGGEEGDVIEREEEEEEDEKESVEEEEEEEEKVSSSLRGQSVGGGNEFYGSHNPRDWAVLQAILTEVEDDEEDEDDVNPFTGLPRTKAHHRESDPMDPLSVEAILNSIGDEDDEDAEDGSPNDFDDILRQITHTASTATDVAPGETMTLPEVSSPPPPTASAHPSSHPAPTTGTLPHSPAAAVTASHAALSHALSYEKRLLHPRHRDAIVSPLSIKRRLKPRVELSTKKRPSSTSGGASTAASTSMAPFGGAGVIQSRTFPRISAELVRNARGRRGVMGLPTALAVNSKFIAIGTQRGVILVFDLFEEVRQQLGRSSMGDEAEAVAGSVTSLDLSYNGEVIISGYTSGYIVLWDVIKGTIMKSVVDVHPSPITSVRFYNDTNYNVISVDAGGLVNKLTFSRNLLWGAYSVDTECLLDGTAGQILALSVLPPDTTKTNSSNTNDLVLIALSSEKSSFAVAVEPTVSVLHRWSRPPPPTTPCVVDSDQQFLPCLAWARSLIGGSPKTEPTLARAWVTRVQFLRASFPEDVPGSGSREVIYPAFGVHDEFETSAPVVSLEWLGSRSLVYLTLTNEFTVVDTVMMTLLERLDFSGVRLIYAEFSLSRSGPTPAGGGGVAGNSTTFQNSMRASDNRLLILCQEELKGVSLLSTKQRIASLEDDGEWLEALALALDHYESTVKSLEDRRRDPVKDWNRHPAFRTGADDDVWIGDLLLRYLKLAVENAPRPSEGNNTPRIRWRKHKALAESHFQMLAGVCVEFCAVTRRTDLLYSSVVPRFDKAGYLHVFFDVMEPYILSDRLTYLAPEVMARFVEWHKSRGDVAAVERCLLHMDVSIMDFDAVVRLLRENGALSALCFVYTEGLGDYVTPAEALCEGVFEAADECDVYAGRRLDGVPQNLFEEVGYKAILYVRHCFQGLTFPQGTRIAEEERVEEVRLLLMRFLMRGVYVPSEARKRTVGEGAAAGKEFKGFRGRDYPYLRILMTVDARVMLEVLSIALDADTSTAAALTSSSTKSAAPATILESNDNAWEVEVTKNDSADTSTGKPDKQRLVSILSSILLSSEDIQRYSSANTPNDHHYDSSSWQSTVSRNAFLDFVAKYLLRRVFLPKPRSLVAAVLRRLASRHADPSPLTRSSSYTGVEGPMSTTLTAPTTTTKAQKSSQEEVMELMGVLPPDSYDGEEVLDIVEGYGMNRACLLLHKMAWRRGTMEEEGREDYRRHFEEAVECYLKDEEEAFSMQVFDFIKKECQERQYGRDRLAAICKKIPQLVALHPLSAVQLVAEVYPDDLEDILCSLSLPSVQGNNNDVEFQFFHAIISGELSKKDPAAGPVLQSNLTLDHHWRYLTLMAHLHPEMVYSHLSTHDNYLPQKCLKLCQDCNIPDASAYLLEKMGNVSSALQLMLQTLEGKLMTLKRVVRALPTEDRYKRRTTHRSKDAPPHPDQLKADDQVTAVKRALTVTLDLCERNTRPPATLPSRRAGGAMAVAVPPSTALSSSTAPQLWFNVLDRLVNAKSFLRLSKEHPTHAAFLTKTLSDGLRMAVQRMVSNVPLADLVRKITTDHAGGRLGEFREMIGGMLTTLGCEVTVCEAAAEVMHRDVRDMMEERRTLKLKGVRVGTLYSIPLGSPKQIPLVEYTMALTAHSSSSSSKGHRITPLLHVSHSGRASLIPSSIPTQDSASRNKIASPSQFDRALEVLEKKRQQEVREGQKWDGRSAGEGIGRGGCALEWRRGGMMMTLKDREFVRGGCGTNDDNDVGVRVIGGLSSAEHYGRFG